MWLKQPDPGQAEKAESTAMGRQVQACAGQIVGSEVLGQPALRGPRFTDQQERPVRDEGRDGNLDQPLSPVRTSAGISAITLTICPL